jgi:hypothetical protein
MAKISEGILKIGKVMSIGCDSAVALNNVCNVHRLPAASTIQPVTSCTTAT